MILFAPWIRTLAVIIHPRNLAVVLITVLTLSASLLLSAGDSAAQTSTSWTYCASENSQCNLSGTREVRYGANGSYSYGIFTNSVSCNNGVFGDPIYGTAKNCEYGNGTSQSSSSSTSTPTNNSSWSYCASEHGQCNFSGTREVRYGANGNYSYGTFTNGVSCNNGVFGDPIYGTAKNCEYGNGTSQSSSSSTSTPTNNSSWSYCASEHGQCNFSGTREVRYGANGNYSYGIFTNSVSCNNGVFGDPIYGYSKACEFGNAASQSTSTTPNPPSTMTTDTGASYYVGKNGSNSYSCSQARSSSTPKLTIGAALACIGTTPGAGAGNVVEVAAGTYTQPIENNLPSGTSWSTPFTLRSKSGDVVTIKASAESNILLSDRGNPSMYYSIIDGFVLDGSNLSNNNITISGTSFVRLINLDIMNTASWSGIYTGYSENLEIINNKIHDGSFLPTGFGHAIYAEGSNNLIDGNEIYNLPAYGVHIYSASGGITSNNIIRNNVVHNFGQKRVTAAGILVSSYGVGNTIYNNHVYNGKGIYNDGGVGIAVDETSNSNVYSNTVYNNTWYGISAQDTTNASVTNNTLYQNGTNLITTGSVGGTFSNN